MGFDFLFWSATIMEEELSLKMKEFLTVIDQVKRYRALLGALPDLAIIIGLTIVGALAMDLSSRLGMVFGFHLGFGIGIVSPILMIIGIVSGFFWVYRKMKRVKVGEWKSTLNEGAPGAIKLLQDINWDNTFRDIRYAKLGFWLYGILKTALLWLVIFVISAFATDWLNAIVHWNLNIVILGLFSLACALTLSTNDFKKRFDQIGRLDALLWELRWFDNEFRRNPFQA